MKPKSNTLYTKEQIKQVIKLWGDYSTEDIAKKLKIEKKQVSYLATQIRAAGFKLPKKHIIGKTRSLIMEVLNELEKYGE